MVELRSYPVNKVSDLLSLLEDNPLHESLFKQPIFIMVKELEDVLSEAKLDVFVQFDDDNKNWRLSTQTKSGAINLIEAERKRQMEDEEWTPEHDDQHTDGQLAEAAACYASFASNIAVPLNESDVMGTGIPQMADLRKSIRNLSLIDKPFVSVNRNHRWPFGMEWFKPSPDDRIKELVKAGALIVAEIERLQRLENKNNQ